MLFTELIDDLPHRRPVVDVAMVVAGDVSSFDQVCVEGLASSADAKYQ